MLKKQIVILLVLFIQIYTLRHIPKIHIESMGNGRYLIAIDQKTAKNKKLTHQLMSQHFQMPPYEESKQSHQKINLNNYIKSPDQIQIQQLPDSQILKKMKGFCIGGKDSKKLTPSQKLQQFKKGKCSPVVIMPGLFATQLIIQIDCQKLKNYNNGQIFHNCGWTSCHRFGLSKTPDKSYVLWMNLNLMLKTALDKYCYGDLFALLVDTQSKVDDYGNRYHFPSGIKSTWFGNTNYTKKNSNCGVNGIQNLGGHNSLATIKGDLCDLNDFQRLMTMLQVLGYEPGITMQPIPYDFRHEIFGSYTPKVFPQSVKNLYHMTGKKVVVVAHSLGTLHTLTGLAYFMTQQQKNQMIRHYIPIAPPWLGTVLADKNILYGDNSYQFFNKTVKIGLEPVALNRYSINKFFKYNGGIIDLLLRDAFDRYKNQPWMKQLLQRIDYEKDIQQQIKAGKTPKHDENYPLNWYPSSTQLCFDDYFKENPYCQMGFVDFLKTPMLTIEGEKYYATINSTKKLFRDMLHGQQLKNVMKFYEQTLPQGKEIQQLNGKSLYLLPAPGVNTSMIFTTVFKTFLSYEFDQKPGTQYQKFIDPIKTHFTPGDKTVPSYSPLIFLTKWISQNGNNGKDIRAVEYCGNYKGSKKHYQTIGCQCLENQLKNPNYCQHSCIIGDKYIIQYILAFLTNGMEGYKDENTSKAIKLDNRFLKNWRDRCYNLIPNNLIKK